jgi:uncharacterized protein (TIGR03437 family)
VPSFSPVYWARKPSEAAAERGLPLGAAVEPSRESTVLYAGAAPGLAAGVAQINVLVPSGLPSGPQFVRIAAGSASSPEGVTVQVMN